jgi:hypothetical protein
MHGAPVVYPENKNFICVDYREGGPPFAFLSKVRAKPR